MEVKTFDTILTELCDDFDSLITPKAISRTNTNIIYLMFKAIAKGFEIINNVCVSLNNKFDPVNCSEDDLESVADIVGAQRLAGSASGLVINVLNTTSESVQMYKGFYQYALNDDTVFTFEVTSETDYIGAGETKSYLAFSNEVGSFAVTEQSSISVTAVSTDAEKEKSISLLTFSCEDNSGILGTEEESNLAFRERIKTDTTRQNSLVELQTTLRNQPYIFDCQLKYNQSTESLDFDGITIPPFYLAIFYSGAPRSDMAEIIASRTIYPTVAVDSLTFKSTELKYENNVFASGYYPINIIPFAKTVYSVDVTYKYDLTYASYAQIQSEISAYLKAKFRPRIHSDYITESDIMDYLKDIGMVNIEFLNVDLYNGSGESKTVASYIEVPKSRLPYLEDVTFTRIAV